MAKYEQMQKDFQTMYTVTTRSIKDEIKVLTCDSKFLVLAHPEILDRLTHRLMCVGFWYGELSSGNFRHLKLFMDTCEKYID